MPAARKSAPEPDVRGQNPLQFVIDVRAWMDDVSDQIDTFKGRMPTPTTGVDAHTLDYLTRIGRLVDQGRADYEAHYAQGT